MVEALVRSDETLFLWINNGWSSPLVDGLMIFATIAGDFIVWVALGFLFIFLKGASNYRRQAVIFLAVMAVAGLSIHAIKKMAPRDRPLKHFQKQIANKTITVNTPLNLLYHRSFPSGHSQAAFTAATFFALYYRRRRPLLYAAASLVAVSRVYLGVHFPSDVVLGSLFGAFMAWLAFKIDPQSPSRLKVHESGG